MLFLTFNCFPRLLTRTQSTIKLTKSSFILWNFYKYQRNVVKSLEPENPDPASHLHKTSLSKIADFAGSRDNLPAARNAQPYINLYSNLNLDELSLSEIEHDALQYFRPNNIINQVNLTSNCLTSLRSSLFANVSFVKLDLTSNYLETIPNGLFDNNREALSQLNISSNFLKSIAKNAFIELTNLQTLSLSHNLLKFDNDKDENVFKNLYKLNRLYLQSNLIDELQFPFRLSSSSFSSLQESSASIDARLLFDKLSIFKYENFSRNRSPISLNGKLLKLSTCKFAGIGKPNSIASYCLVKLPRIICSTFLSR